MDYDALWTAVWQGRYHAEFNSDYHLMAADAWAAYADLCFMACMILGTFLMAVCVLTRKRELKPWEQWAFASIVLATIVPAVLFVVSKGHQVTHGEFCNEWNAHARDWQTVEDQFATACETDSALHIGRLRQVTNDIEDREPKAYDYAMAGEAQKRTDKRMGVVRDEKGARVQ